MKRILTCLLVLTLLAALAGCAGGLTPANPSKPTMPHSQNDTTEPDVTLTPPETVEPTSGALETETFPPESSEEPSDIPESSEENAGGFTPELEAAYALLTETYSAEGEYTVASGDYSYESYYSYHLPHLIPTTEGANEINMAIADRFAAEIEESLDYISQGIGSGLLSVGWYLYCYDDVMSLIVTESYDWEWAGYEVYYYDMATGEALTQQQMLERIVLTEEDFLDGVRKDAVLTFETQYSGLSSAQREEIGYEDLIAHQASDELINFNFLRFYVDEAGHIGVFTPIVSVAGADWYYRLLYPEFSMG